MNTTSLNTDQPKKTPPAVRFFAAVTLLCFAAAACLWADCIIRQCTWEHVTTTVTRHRVEEDLFNGGLANPDGGYKLYPAAFFTDASGESHFFESRKGYAPADAPRQGSALALIYPAGKPQEAQENSFSEQFFLPAVVTLVSLLPAALTLFFRRRKQG